MGINTLRILTGATILISSKAPYLVYTRTLCVFLTCYQWWRDVSHERSIQGFHTTLVVAGLRWGIILFIISEILFFTSFFWAFFHRRLAPNLELGSQWPPMGVLSINPFHVPLLNTAVLLARGVTVTWAHHALIQIKNTTTTKAIQLTIFLGVYFTTLQGWEYWDASFGLADSTFGSVFFLATGFHGIHVIIGSLFLTISFLRHKLNIYSLNHHTGLERAIWYWHFVDVVWLFLFTFIYWWSF